MDTLTPSKMGLASRICCSIQECFPLMAARYCKISLVLSVLPAPDSPLIKTTNSYISKSRMVFYNETPDDLRLTDWNFDCNLSIWRYYSPDNDALILTKAFHLSVAIIAYGEDVRRQFADFPLPVHFNLLGRVNGQNLVRIDGHQNRSSVSLL